MGCGKDRRWVLRMNNHSRVQWRQNSYADHGEDGKWALCIYAHVYVHTPHTHIWRTACKAEWKNPNTSTWENLRAFIFVQNKVACSLRLLSWSFALLGISLAGGKRVLIQQIASHKNCSTHSVNVTFSQYIARADVCTLTARRAQWSAENTIDWVFKR